MSAIKKFYSRAELGMQAPRSVSYRVDPGRGGVAVHYGGAAQNIDSEARARAVWLGWQRFHRNTRNWADIAYTAGFDNWGNVYAGRGFGVRTAAQGTNDGNNRYYAFVWLGGGNEKPSREALEALNWLIDEARREGGAGLDVRPHSSFKSTSCPGSLLVTRAGELNGKRDLPPPAGTSPAPEPPAPAPKPPASRDIITVGDRGPEVRSWQQDLLKWRPGIIEAGATGNFFEQTRAATITFYRAVGLISSVANPAMPRVGPKSREAMKKALAKPTFRFRYTSILRRGSTGPAVDEWQRAVRAWDSSLIPGYHQGVGIFGPQTESATRNVQGRLGIKVDGVVGPTSRRAMAAALSGGSSGGSTQKTVAQMAQEVIDGKHGTGHSNRRRSLGLTQDAYAQVRKEVNRRLR